MDEFPEWRYGPGLLGNQLAHAMRQVRFAPELTSIAMFLVVVGPGGLFDLELTTFSYSSHPRAARRPHWRYHS